MKQVLSLQRSSRACCFPQYFLKYLVGGFRKSSFASSQRSLLKYGYASSAVATNAGHWIGYISKTSKSGAVAHFPACERAYSFETADMPLQAPSDKQQEETSDIPTPDLDYGYLCNEENREEIEINIKNRKGVGNIREVQKLNRFLQSAKSTQEKEKLYGELVKEAIKIPNRTHPKAYSHGQEQQIVNEVGRKPDFGFPVKDFDTLASNLKLLRKKNLGNLTGHRSYYFTNILAQLEQALVQYTVNRLLRKKFRLFSVPDLLHPAIVEGCGMNTRGERTQVYALTSHHGQVCLSGTSEMALGGYFMNQVLQPEVLPLRIMAVSRCYRAETSVEEWGMYRVHQFTKVEMFGITANETGHESEALLMEFLDIEQQLYSDLGLHFQVLHMPFHELGSAAYQKYDIEAWMPGRKIFGEISSCSNCTDYQSRRLNVRYIKPKLNEADNNKNDTKYVHTLNGTACATPRMLISIFENFQQADGTVLVPDVLQPYLGGQKVIKKPAKKLNMKWVQNKKL